MDHGEPLDLRLLPTPEKAQSQSVPSTELRSSYRQAVKKGWKPMTLQPITLVCVASFTSVLIGVLSYLASINDAQNGLAFAPAQEGLSPLTIFAYNYLPTILAVLFSMFWAWVDLDIKRLEPFFQMSSVNGVSMQDSVLLQYPFDFIAWAPVKAARRRHWGVFVGGLVTVLIFWAITPLQGAVFNTGTIVQTIDVKLSSTSSLQSVKATGADMALDISFTERVWNIFWYNSTLPPFTTRQGAVLPFGINEKSAVMSNATLQANGTLITTTLECAPVNVNITDPGDFHVDLGPDCQFPIGLTGTNIDVLLYFGNDSDPLSDWSLSAVGCNEAPSPNGFLAIVASLRGSVGASSTSMDLQTQFCTPRYWTQDIVVSIEVPTMEITQTFPVGPPMVLPQTEMNATMFEYVISSGNTYVPDRAAASNLSAPAKNTISQWNKLLRYNVSQVWITPMAGFIFGASEDLTDSFDDLLDPTTLVAALEKTHQLLFAVAVSTIFSNAPDKSASSISRTGHLSRAMLAVQLQQPFGYIIQTLLAISAVCALFLAAFYWQRPSQLASDPDSLRHVGRMKTNITRDTLKCCAQECPTTRFRLLRQDDQNMLLVIVQQTPSHRDSSPSAKTRKNSNQRRVSSDPSRPFYLGAIVGTSFLFALAAISIALIILQQQSIHHQGLSLPWTDPLVQQLILNYLPTLVATILEPFWTLLNRTYCLLLPFEELRCLQAKALASIDSRYASLPPQLTIIRALRGRHILLVVVCITSLSCNILAVSMNALFDQVNTAFPQPTSFPHLSEATFGPISTDFGRPPADLDIWPNHWLQDQFYLANANLTEGAALPAWTSSDHALLPLDFTGVDNNSAKAYQLDSLRGFSVETDCQDLGDPTQDGLFQLKIADQPSTATYETGKGTMFTLQISVQQTMSAGAINCTAELASMAPDPNSGAFEAFTSFNQTACGQYFFSMYARELQANSSHFAASSFTFMMCKTSLATAIYDPVVDALGRVIKSTQQPDSWSSDMSPYFQIQSDADFFVSRLNYINMISATTVGDAAPNVGHTIIASGQWFPYLISKCDNSTDTIDPSKPAPSVAKLVPLVKAVNAQLAALVISSQREKLIPDISPSASKTPTTVSATYNASTQRLFFDPLMFPVTIALLTANILVGLIFYVRAPKKLLPEMPTTVCAQMKLFFGSSIEGPDDVSLEQRERERYGYGRFLGEDGKLHVGIEKVPFVQPVR